MPKLVLEMGGALASHLSITQAARVLGRPTSSVWHQVQSGTIPVAVIAGSEMVPSLAVLHLGGIAAPVALPPSGLMLLLRAALRAVEDGESDRPLFTPQDLLGVYLGVSRLPWPPPPSLTEDPNG